MERLYNKAMQLSVEYFHCYILCYTLKVVLDYFKQNFPEYFPLLEIKVPSAGASADLNEKCVDYLLDFWNINPIDNMLQYDEYLNSLNFDIDPFMNEAIFKNSS